MWNSVGAMLVCSGVSLWASFNVGDSGRELGRAELMSVNGGSTYYCAQATNSSTNAGCADCQLVQANWQYYNGNTFDSVSIYKKCTGNTSIDQLCVTTNWTSGGYTKYCVKNEGLACGVATAVNSFVDNTCATSPSAEMQAQKYEVVGSFVIPDFPTIQCTRTYSTAGTSPATGVNCSNVTPGVEY